ncbi:MAG: hypothetical protein PHV17_02750, partial [Candidatus Omnitrophica bacterium]|nr:hypothetical protein [Candidatus Omnitrophota bacterium]
QRPVSVVLAPIVRAFFGDKFLHYPYNLFLLPELFRYGQILVEMFVGVFMTATLVAMLDEINSGERLSFPVALVRSGRRYPALIITWIIIFGITKGAWEVMTKFAPQAENFLGVLVTIFSFFVYIISQILFIYLVPLIIIKREKLVVALKDNFKVVKKLFLPTIPLAVIPSVFYLPIIVARLKLLFFVKTFEPEAVIVILAVGIFVTFIVNLVITISTTLLFLENELE